MLVGTKLVIWPSASPRASPRARAMARFRAMLASCKAVYATTISLQQQYH